MTKKIQKEFVDVGFGFPVVLLHVPMVKARGVWIPQVDHHRLATAVLRALASKLTRWTGHEVRFVRQQLRMTLRAFAERFYVTHPAVMKWEARGDRPTNMNWATEKDLRLFVHLHTAGEEGMIGVYQDLRREKPARPRRMRINVRQVESVIA